MKNYLRAIFVCSLFFVSIEYQAQWVTNGPANNAVKCLVTNGSNIFAGTNSGVYTSSDNGMNWNVRNNGLFVGSGIEALAINDSYIFAAALNGGLFRSFKNGVDWESASNGLADGGVSTSALAINGPIIFAGGIGIGMYLSNNNGANWSAINNGFPTNTYVRAIAITNTKIFVGNNQMGGTYVSTNGGMNWTNTGMVFQTSFSIGGSTILAGGDHGISISTDYGNSWNGTITQPPNTNVHSVIIDNNNFFAGTEGGIFISQNNGVSWKEVNAGLGNISILSLATDGQYLYAGTNGSGVWRRSISEMITDVNDRQDNLPTEYKLEQNYPNPFNPTTKISWQLPVSSHVTLKVYDLLGREVATLVNEEKAPGEYSVKFRAQSLPSGVYFYTLSTNGFFQSKKMLLMK